MFRVKEPFIVDVVLFGIFLIPSLIRTPCPFSYVGHIDGSSHSHYSKDCRTFSEFWKFPRDPHKKAKACPMTSTLDPSPRPEALKAKT